MEMSHYQIIIRPVNTEKSTNTAELGQYTFMVHPWANKLQIAEAVAYIFDVDVVKVRVLNRAPKFGRWGRKRVQRESAHKKAIVTLAPGQRIEAFEGV
ncbi:MAG: 50S ribosomal protein L23 [Anaerolineae bacterium]